MRTRGGEPTLMCRSEPPVSTSARRYGSTDRAEVARVDRSDMPNDTDPTEVRLTSTYSAPRGPVLTSGPTIIRSGFPRPARRVRPWGDSHHEETTMSKRARKRRARKGKGANHGRRPNA